MNNSSKMTCSYPAFLQSRGLIHLVSEQWSKSLFKLLNQRPVDTLYSIAFSLSFTPTFGVLSTNDENAIAHYTASRELFDLLDDCIRDTDSLNMAELLRTRPASIESFAKSNDDYRIRTRPLVEFIERYDIFDVTSTAISQVSVEDRATILHTFQRLNNEVAAVTGLPFLISADGTKTIDRFDINAVQNASNEQLLQSPSDGGWSIMKTYVYYNYILARYDSLQSILHQIESVRDGVHIIPLLIPLGCAWQIGMSQLLWILLHNLAALSVARRNIYINRLLVLLRNLSFFIWCGQCAIHWRTNGGGEYFNMFSELDARDLNYLPIDIILMRCHNTVATNIHPNKRLSTWTLAQLILDYREFVERQVLSRRPAICNRTACPCGEERSEDNLTFVMRPLYVTTDMREFSADELWRLARGDWLLFKLWVTIDPKQFTLRAS